MTIEILNTQSIEKKPPTKKDALTWAHAIIKRNESILPDHQNNPAAIKSNEYATAILEKCAKLPKGLNENMPLRELGDNEAATGILSLLSTAARVII